jgi:hypothetical protein
MNNEYRIMNNEVESGSGSLKLKEMKKLNRLLDQGHGSRICSLHEF